MDGKTTGLVSPPPFARFVLERLGETGFEAYVVGGAVRDSLLGRRADDWDVATSAMPEDVCGLFPNHRDVGRRFGTITVFDGSDEVEVTTFRGERGYSDKRHPDEVTLGVRLVEDLARRDFTMNAMAWSPDAGLVDPFRGLSDLQARRLAAVGEARERFQEDGLRILRAARFAAVLCLRVDVAAKRAMMENASALADVAAERLGPELDRLLVAPARGLRHGLRLLCATGVLKVILPEVAATYGVTQNAHHRYSVWHHTVLAATGVPDLLALRWAALLHDVGKVRTRSTAEDGRVHFYGHEVVSAEMAEARLRRLAYPRRLVDTVTRLVRNHMFPIGPEVSDAAIRRLALRVGIENMSQLIALKRADLRSKGTAAPTTDEDRLEDYRRRVGRVLGVDADAGEKPAWRDLAISGEDVMRLLGIDPGPQVGWMLARLHEAVIENPALNTTEALYRLLSTWPGPR